jgi:hypothetical protein
MHGTLVLLNRRRPRRDRHPLICMFLLNLLDCHARQSNPYPNPLSSGCRQVELPV